MDRFARVVLGYHGCEPTFAEALIRGELPIDEWQPSQNPYDWLGHGIYFWEHAPERAWRWARERYRTRRQRPAVLGAYIQLGRCVDLLDESITALLGETYELLTRAFAEQGRSLASLLRMMTGARAPLASDLVTAQPVVQMLQT